MMFTTWQIIIATNIGKTKNYIEYIINNNNIVSKSIIKLLYLLEQILDNTYAEILDITIRYRITFAIDGY